MDDLKVFSMPQQADAFRVVIMFKDGRYWIVDDVTDFGFIQDSLAVTIKDHNFLVSFDLVAWVGRYDDLKDYLPEAEEA